MKNAILIILLSTLITYSWAQAPASSYILSAPVITTSNYVARDFVRMKPGFKFSASAGTVFKAKIDENLLIEVNTDTEITESDLHIDKSPNVAVGTTSGMFSASGSASYQIPIIVPPGSKGMAPSLTINYNSLGGNGNMGVGWSLAGNSSITRAPKTLVQDGQIHGVDLTAEDRFAMNGQRLMALSGTYGANGTTYSTELESFVTVTSYETNGAFEGPEWFKVTSDNGIEMEFGKDNNSLFTKDNKNIEWKLSKISDQLGNYMTYHYIMLNDENVLSEIKYTGNTIEPYNSIKFKYAIKNVTNYYFINGVKLSNSLLVTGINLTSENNLVRNYKFVYTDGLNMRLQEVFESGSDGITYNSTKFKYGDELTSNISNTKIQNERHYSKFWTGDYNGDGKTDLIEFNFDIPTSIKNTKIIYFYWNLLINKGGNLYQEVLSEQPLNEGFELLDYLYPINKGSAGNMSLTNLDFNGDGNDDAIFTTIGNDSCKFEIFKSNGTTLIKSDEFTEPNLLKYLFGDFDGDKRMDIFFHSYEAGNSFANVGIRLGGTNLGRVSKQIDQTYDFENSLVFDMNGDGIPEVINIRKGGEIYYMSYQNGDFVFKKDSSLSFPLYAEELFGDFNGDGISDRMIYSPNIEGSRWMLRYGKGNSTYDDSYTTSIHKPTYDNHDNEEQTKFTIDINGDGRTDIVEFYEGYLYIHYSNGYSFITDAIISDDWYQGPNQSQVLFGDFDRDGLTDIMINDIMASSSENNIYICSPHKFTNSQRISKIMDGLGNLTTIEYSSLSNGSIYTKATDAVYPVKDFQGALNVVSKVTTSDGVGGISENNYSYSGAKIHLTGKGFLGFKSTVVTNRTTNSKVTNTMDWDKTNYLPKTSISKVEVLSSAKVLNQNTQNYSYTPLNATIGSERYFHFISSKDELNGLTNTTTHFGYTYFPDNKLESETINYGNKGGVNKTTNSYTYVNANGRYMKLVNASTLKKTLNAKEFSMTTSYGYNSKGLPASITNYKGIVTNFTYDAFGNVLHTDTDGTHQVDYTYDTKGRFVASKKLINDATQMETFTCDSKTGNVLTNTSINGLTTTYTYDGFGRLVSTLTPEGHNISHKLIWDTNDADNIYYYSYTSIPGKPDGWEYFDGLGRNVKTATEGYDGNQIFTKVNYRPDGKIDYKTWPYQAARESTVSKTIYAYNLTTGILSGVTDNGVTTSYSQSGLIYTETKPGSKVFTKVYDGAGHLITATDAGGTLTYSYHPSGQVESISYNNGATTTIAYDALGSQDKLTDPNAGTIDYNYDKYDRMQSMTDAKNISRSYLYDALDRTTKETTPEGDITYDYFTSGGGKNQVKTITGFGIAVSYTYDSYGRVLTETKNIPGNAALTKTYSYDAYGNNTTVAYSTGFTLTNEYSNGYLKKVKNGTTVLWEGVTMNDLGQIEQSKIGGASVIKGYTDGYLSSINYSGFEQFTYNWNKNTGNLTNRHASYSNKTEEFAYDALDRLTGVTNGSTSAVQYDNNGNILSKTGAGYYSYSPTKINATTGVSETKASATTIPTNISTTAQNITYTSFHKAKTITEGDSLYTIGYSPQKQRATMEYKSATQAFLTYYYGEYEKETDIKTGVIKETYYIAGLDGICALYVVKNGAPTTYYVHTDHLGSIMTLRNGSTVTERFSYDAWGRKRNPMNYTYTGFTASTITNRGFTGHEHLFNVGLINMNGRMYDPILGRFLSPDNYVQAPDITQSYNRYSYCMNNPLKYTDPTGFTWFTRAGDWLGDDGKILATIALSIAVSAVVVASCGTLAPLAVAVIAGASSGMAGAALGTAFAGGSGKDFVVNMVIGAGVGAISGMAGYGAGYFGGSIARAGILKLGEGAVSPIFYGAAVGVGGGALGGGAAGYAGGFLNSYARYGDLDAANEAGWNGAKSGAIMGGGIGLVTGVYGGYKYANAKNLDPWTGKSLAPDIPDGWPTPPIDGPLKVGDPSRQKPLLRGEKSIYDNTGGEWRYDAGHRPNYTPHWDYKAPGNNMPWQNIDILKINK